MRILWIKANFDLSGIHVYCSISFGQKMPTTEGKTRKSAELLFGLYCCVHKGIKSTKTFTSYASFHSEDGTSAFNSNFLTASWKFCSWVHCIIPLFPHCSCLICFGQILPQCPADMGMWGWPAVHPHLWSGFWFASVVGLASSMDGATVKWIVLEYLFKTIIFVSTAQFLSGYAFSRLRSCANAKTRYSRFRLWTAWARSLSCSVWSYTPLRNSGCIRYWKRRVFAN